MLLEVTQEMIIWFKKLWELFLNGGYIGMFIILFPIMKKLVSLMKQFL